MYHISNIRKIYSIVLIIMLWIGLQYVIIRKKELNVILLRIMTSVWMHHKISFQKSCSFLSFLNTSSNFIFTSVRISIDIYLYSEKLKCAIIVNFFIIKTYINKIHHFKDKNVNRNTVTEEKNIRHSKIDPGLPGHKSTFLTNTPRDLSLQNYQAKNSENVLIDFETNYTFCIHN